MSKLVGQQLESVRTRQFRDSNDKLIQSFAGAKYTVKSVSLDRRQRNQFVVEGPKDQNGKTGTFEMTIDAGRMRDLFSLRQDQFGFKAVEFKVVSHVKGMAIEEKFKNIRDCKKYAKRIGGSWNIYGMIDGRWEALFYLDEMHQRIVRQRSDHGDMTKYVTF